MRQFSRVKPWLENTLQLLDWADWKTWVWYSFLGIEKVTSTILVWVKRQRKVAEVRVKNGRFYVVKKRA